MTYYINPIWFYLVDFCDKLWSVLGIFASFTWILLFISVIIYFISFLNDELEIKRKETLIFVKFWVVSTIIAIVLTIGVIICPTGEAVTRMLIASIITEENVDSVKGDVLELIDYTVDKINEVKEK